jgi:predicted nucleic acid-binding Zn ribbon protein
VTYLREVKKIVKETFQKFNLGEESQKLFAIWQEELGELAKHAQIGNFREGKLLVEVDNPVYMQELSAKRKSIMEKVNKRMGKKFIVEVRFRLGKTDRSRSEN